MDSPYLCRIRTIHLILLLLLNSVLLSQTETPKKEKYDKKEEIIYNNKLYRKHNNYVTMGLGYMGSSIRKDMQRVFGADFNFHVRRQHFQLGVSMSGQEFLSNNNVQAHLGYGVRNEKNLVNLAAFGGITYYTGVIGVTDSANNSIPLYYQGVGFYACGQLITKLTYDIGAGIEVFGEVSKKQNLAGVKFILFFSGAYRGAKKNYNPNVRSENQK